MGIVAVNDMEFYSYHGHFQEEQLVGNHFRVHVWLEFDCTKASETDHLHDALDYQQVYALVKEEMEKPSKLLEHLGGRILDRFQASFPDVAEATVKIEKMNPPLGGKIKSVSVELSRKFI